VAEVEVVPTSAGPVEIARIPGEKLPVLFFSGGHCSARSDCGWSLYTQSGHGVMSFSRPGYGATRVGAVTAAEFAPVVRDVCRQLNVGPIAAAVGVSFGGLQAVHVAGDRALAVPRLILHSCAPSVLPYPDTRSETVAGPLMFSPVLQGILWRLVRRMVRSESGLRRMMAHLSRLPVDEGWGELTAADKDDARALFEAMESGSASSTTSAKGVAARHRTGWKPCWECRARRSSPVPPTTVVSHSRTRRTSPTSSPVPSSPNFTHLLTSSGSAPRKPRWTPSSAPS
jgi:pimeloyl-ACP methyl ester carboxylesterase